jgi:hypothetical protein
MDVRATRTAGKMPPGSFGYSPASRAILELRLTTTARPAGVTRTRHGDPVTCGLSWANSGAARSKRDWPLTDGNARQYGVEKLLRR